MVEEGVRHGLAGLRILVVEDEALVALNLESMLEDLGCRVLGPVMRLEQLERTIAEGPAADVAILDVNVDGVEVFPHAERLVASGLPVVFATGYGRSGVPDAWRDWPIVQKPYTPDEIGRALALALSPSAAVNAGAAPATRRGIEVRRPLAPGRAAGRSAASAMRARSLTAAALCLVAAISPALAKPARCFTTDDGHFDCEFRATDRRGSFEIEAPGLPLYGLEIERPGSAFGFVTINGRTVALPGRYLRESGDGACWANTETGARICAW